MTVDDAKEALVDAERAVVRPRRATHRGQAGSRACVFAQSDPLDHPQ
jgi:hypothetical protein